MTGGYGYFDLGRGMKQRQAINPSVDWVGFMLLYPLEPIQEVQHDIINVWHPFCLHLFSHKQKFHRVRHMRQSSVIYPLLHCCDKGNQFFFFILQKQLALKQADLQRKPIPLIQNLVDPFVAWPLLLPILISVVQGYEPSTPITETLFFAAFSGLKINTCLKGKSSL